MNKKLVIIIALLSQFVQADPHKHWLATNVCDIIGLIPPTWVKGVESAQYGVLETDEEKIKAGNCVDNTEGKHFVKLQNAAPKLADDTTDPKLKAIFKVLKTKDENRQEQINANVGVFHNDWAQNVYRFKSGSYVEKVYFFGFWAAAIIGGGKLAQKIYDNYIDDQEKKINFDQFAEDDIEDTVQKLKEAVNAQA